MYTLGWILIFFLIVLIISLNVSLFTGLKNKNKRGKDHWITKIQNTGDILKDPFQAENMKMLELSEKVERLKKNQPTTNQDPSDQNHAGEIE